MKYTYAYRTSDGIRHEAAMEAASREAVFAVLRQRGIKAIKVVAADGSKANGEVRGVRKRVVVICVLCLVLGAVAASIMSFRAGKSNNQTTKQSNNSPSALPTTADRHQVYGDPALIQEIESGALSVATSGVEKFLLAYAIPGRAVSAGPVPAGVDAAALVPTPLTSADRPEVTAYRQILNGLKAEAKAYLEGGGTWSGFVAALNERQRREIEIYEQARRELESVTDPALRAERNAALRAMGLRTIPRPRK